MEEKSVSIITLGCKVNQYESEVLHKLFSDNNFLVTPSLVFANYYIINTCAVTNEAEHKSRGVITKINKINPNAKIYICGCSSHIHPQSYMEKPNVCAVIGTENKLKLIDIIKNDQHGIFVEKTKNTYKELGKAKTIKTRSTIKIQDGCNNFCTYCIIPYTRGRERSRKLEEIKKELSTHAKISKEIVLVGINVAAYGKDLSPQRNLVDVAKLFEEHPELRIRFSSLEMGSISEELLIELKKLPNFCDFFHLSLQSANDNVLMKMNRHYLFVDYQNTINLILKYFPRAMISTDIIVGFPTETDKDFLIGLENLKKIPFGNIHIFPYSRRDGTAASAYPILDGKIVKQRAEQLKQVADDLKQKYITSNIGENDEVLIEETTNGYSSGYLKNYLRCYVKTNCNLQINEIYKIKIIGPYKNGVLGEIIYE